MPHLVDVRGIGSDRLLEHLWRAARFEPHVLRQRHRPQWDLAASTMGMEGGFISYAQNKAIMCNIKQEFVDPTEYNRHNGEGTFERVVTALRSGIV